MMQRSSREKAETEVNSAMIWLKVRLPKTKSEFFAFVPNSKFRTIPAFLFVDKERISSYTSGCWYSSSFCRINVSTSSQWNEPNPSLVEIVAFLSWDKTGPDGFEILILSELKSTSLLASMDVSVPTEVLLILVDFHFYSSASKHVPITRYPYLHSTKFWTKNRINNMRHKLGDKSYPPFTDKKWEWYVMTIKQVSQHNQPKS